MACLLIIIVIIIIIIIIITIIIIIFIIIFKSPTSTKPVGLKIVKLDIVLMVELAVLFVWKRV